MKMKMVYTFQAQPRRTFPAGKKLPAILYNQH